MAKGKHGRSAERRREEAQRQQDAAQAETRAQAEKRALNEARLAQEKSRLAREITELQEQLEQRVAETSEEPIREIVALQSFLAEHQLERERSEKLRTKKWEAIYMLAGTLGVPGEQFAGLLLDCVHVTVGEVQNAPRGFSVVNQRRAYGARAVNRFDALLTVLIDHPETAEALRDLSKSWSREIDLDSDEHDPEASSTKRVARSPRRHRA